MCAINESHRQLVQAHQWRAHLVGRDLVAEHDQLHGQQPHAHDPHPRRRSLRVAPAGRVDQPVPAAGRGDRGGSSTDSPSAAIPADAATTTCTPIRGQTRCAAYHRTCSTPCVRCAPTRRSPRLLALRSSRPTRSSKSSSGTSTTRTFLPGNGKRRSTASGVQPEGLRCWRQWMTKAHQQTPPTPSMSAIRYWLAPSG